MQGQRMHTINSQFPSSALGSLPRHVSLPEACGVMNIFVPGSELSKV